MARHRQKRLLPYSTGLLFDLVADVERYPEFLPMWESAVVSDRTAYGYATEQTIHLGLATVKFHSMTALHRPTHIDVTSRDSFFRKFELRWEFRPVGRSACCVALTLSSETRSIWMQGVADMVLADATRDIVSAFEKRARDLYGPGAKLRARDRLTIDAICGKAA